MRNIFKRVFFVFLAMSMISFGPIGQLKALAEGVNKGGTNVHIVKVRAEKGTAEIPGTGKRPEEAFKDSSKIKPVKGAKFKVYKVKDANALSAIKAVKDNADQVKAKLSGIEPKETGFTNESGEAVINLEDGYYWVEESVVPATFKSGIATSFALTLPAYVDGKVAKDFYVYPKNVLEIPFNPNDGGKENPPTLKKTVEGGKDTNKTTSKSVFVGEEETWNITGVAPQSVKDLKKLVFLDRISQYLDVVEGSLKVTAGGRTLYENGEDKGGYFTTATINNDSKVSEGQSLLNVTFSETGIKSLKPGDEIVITFKTKVNNKAIMGRNIYNGVKVVYNNDPGKDFTSEIPGNPNKDPNVPKDPNEPNEPKNPGEPDVPPTDPDVPPTNPDNPNPENPYTPFVNTGGKKFVKVDTTETSTGLTGAEFAIIRTNEAGNIEFYSKNGETPQWVDTGVKATAATNTEAVTKAIKAKSDSKAVTVKSEAEGKFEVKGLPYGTYKLVELTAPKDYALPENMFEFKINAKSYYVNAYLTEGLNEDKNLVKPESTNGGQIKNTKYTIPQTGGMGTIILTAIGVTLLVGAYVVYKKNNLSHE